MGSSHRLSNRYRGNAYANRYPSNGDEQSQQCMNCCERCLHFGSPQDINRNIREDEAGRGGLFACERFRIPHCLDNHLIDGGKVVSPTHRPHFTPQKHYFFNVSGTDFC
jgi:hypothetical protein